MSKFDTHGGYFAPKEYVRINEGGSHEENPNGGVQLGVDPEGTPNLLEEGEPVYKDYVYSDNIEAEEEFLVQNNIPKKYGGKLYSKIADDIFTEAEERPLDPISRNGLETMLGRLADAQEAQKQAQQQRELEEELAQLSPEELDQLEQMLAQGEQPVGTDNPMYGEGPVGAQGEPGIPPEQMMGPAEPMMQQPAEGMPMRALGGSIHKYDGESENTGFLRRLLSSPVAVPNMTGTATAAATSLGSIPMTQSTVGREAAVAGTALAAPAVYALTANPLVQTAADAYLTADGIKNALSDEGIAKTVRLAKEGDTWGAVKSGLMDALDIAGAYSLASKAGRVGKALHEVAPGVALTPEQIAKRLADAEKAGKKAAEAEAEAKKAAKEVEKLRDEVVKADRDRAEYTRFAEGRKRRLEHAEEKLATTERDIEQLVEAQEAALKSGERLTDFDARLSSLKKLRESRKAAVETAKEISEGASKAEQSAREALSKQLGDYWEAADKASIPYSYSPTTPESARRVNVLKTIFDPTYSARRGAYIDYSRGIRDFELADAQGKYLFSNTLSGLPVALGETAALVGATYGLVNADELLEKNQKKNSSDMTASPADSVGVQAPVGGVWSSEPYIATPPAIGNRTTRWEVVDSTGTGVSSVPVQTDTAAVGYDRGGKINRYDDGGWADFLKRLAAYDYSKNPSAVSGKYAIDRRYDVWRGRTAKQIQDDQAYKDFTKYVIDHPDDPNVRRYLEALDAGVAAGTPTLIDPKTGKLVDKWNEIFDWRRNDDNLGIYHLNPEDIGFLTAPTVAAATVQEPRSVPADYSDPRVFFSQQNVGYGENSNFTPEEYTRITGRAVPAEVRVPDVKLSDFDPNVYPIEDASSVDLGDLGKVDVPSPSSPSVSDGSTRPDILPTWPRYAGAVGSGILGLYNVFQQPDIYRTSPITPQTPEGRIHLQNQVYNPIDQNMVANSILNSGNAVQRVLRNSGLGPSASAAILAAGNNTTGNLGTGFIQSWDANNQRRNQVIAANNAAEAQRANFDYAVDQQRKAINNQFALQNRQNDLLLQRLNYASEADKYNAVSNQINAGLQALSGIDRENFAMNQINTNPAFLGYGYGANGTIHYNPITGRWEMSAPVSSEPEKKAAEPAKTAPQTVKPTAPSLPLYDLNTGLKYDTDPLMGYGPWTRRQKKLKQ